MAAEGRRDPEGAQPTTDQQALRDEIGRDFSRLYKDAVKRLEEVVTREGAYTGKCVNCRRDVRVDNVPPVRDIVLALQFLADQGIGKPSPAPAKQTAPKLAGSVTNATDQELEAILAGSPEMGS